MKKSQFENEGGGGSVTKKWIFIYLANIKAASTLAIVFENARSVTRQLHLYIPWTISIGWFIFILETSVE